ncbi:AcvB/VirJ family lysyl-phosphatidylglycerol hydrolase [Frigoriflavimonas asaccharolytica]|uniref:AcvB/VirJ family lysyl-phosphatidylglycerol hydrolase n=1 Tax=Frigoriflavimonas asaccharolytica TaxID=2735899 RepID=UPI00156E7BFB|nr:AcvB/VirJ family lysyl-phosphatidylglycerol hydrolase [Frigoriflavimonas asaccharolytica]
MKSFFKLSKLLCLLSLLFIFSCEDDGHFIVSKWNSNNESKPIIFYISGDGGFNTFSQSMGKDLHNLGYDVFALDTKDYFWQNKSPQEASEDTEKFLKKMTKHRDNKKVILIGYSYGAEVAPFIYNRFDDDFKENISKLIIIGPTAVNDFKIHLDEYVFKPVQYGYSVVKEVNKLGSLPFTLVVSDDEVNAFPKNKITLKSYEYMHLAGSHDFSGNTQMVVDSISKYF